MSLVKMYGIFRDQSWVLLNVTAGFFYAWTYFTHIELKMTHWYFNVIFLVSCHGTDFWELVHYVVSDSSKPGFTQASLSGPYAGPAFGLYCIACGRKLWYLLGGAGRNTIFLTLYALSNLGVWLECRADHNLATEALYEGQLSSLPSGKKVHKLYLNSA